MLVAALASFPVKRRPRVETQSRLAAALPGAAATLPGHALRGVEPPAGMSVCRWKSGS
ncbi:conserved hypothetical protein [Mesorhizobium ventifaucium]|uniref:Propionyl-coenzyme A carboxylase alpha polypeptide n=1 Tax=Mesorhizobium ventifaucium TaxID=666020 RepID=A0ABM9DK13_9HYPH|nr:conserved hypothetical protein [Mesorhizobium ventifaucium]